MLRSKVDVAMPYRRLATKLFTTAADPESPLSPFSQESSPLRLAAIEVLRETIEGADLKVPRALRADLPELLWLYEMGILLYWVHDASKGSTRTYTLIDRTVPVVDRLIGLSRLPVVRPLVRDLLGLLDELRP